MIAGEFGENRFEDIGEFTTGFKFEIGFELGLGFVKLSNMFLDVSKIN